jgi:hypothetical protein
VFCEPPVVPPTPDDPPLLVPAFAPPWPFEDVPPTELVPPAFFPALPLAPVDPEAPASPALPELAGP